MLRPSRKPECGWAGPRRERRAFTLMELLIVIAIISVLIMIMAPLFAGLKPIIRRFQCGTNMHSLVQGWGLYTENNRKWIPSSDTGSWGGSWVNADGYHSLDKNSPNYMDYGPVNGSIYKYTGAIELYKCPAFIEVNGYDYAITYGASSYLNGQHESASYRPGTIKKFDKIENPAHTFWIIDEWDNRMWIMGSFAPFQYGPYHWWDVVAGNHMKGDNLAFVDGHVEYWQWLDRDTLTYMGGHYATDPGSVDCDRLRAAMFGEDVPHAE